VKSDAPGFPHRNGFAMHADLGHPRLRELRTLCLHEQEGFGEAPHLDWSRQWEYPFVLANLPENGAGSRILDAGCGYRFFAPLLARRGYEVYACDLDASIGARYDALCARHDVAVEFERQDLEKMTYSDGVFEHICCISVLEHARDPAAIAREFRRCLKPGGSLLLTFDVSASGDRDISVAGAKELLALLGEEFTAATPFCGEGYLDEARLPLADEVLRTSWFRHHQPELLPWRFISRSSLRNMLKGRFGRPFYDLAVIGLVLYKDQEADPRLGSADAASKRTAFAS
jgi:SAM-dependent methyltransferase